MEAHWLTIKENHDRFQAKQIKKSAAIARKSINELKKLATKYRSTQLAETKEI